MPPSSQFCCGLLALPHPNAVERRCYSCYSCYTDTDVLWIYFLCVLCRNPTCYEGISHFHINWWILIQQIGHSDTGMQLSGNFNEQQGPGTMDLLTGNITIDLSHFVACCLPLGVSLVISAPQNGHVSQRWPSLGVFCFPFTTQFRHETKLFLVWPSNNNPL